MVFIDHENLKKCLDAQEKPRIYNPNTFGNFIMEYLENTIGWKKYTPRLIRTYIYTGEYTKSLMGNLKSKLTRTKKRTDLNEEEKKAKINHLESIIKIAKENKELQRAEFNEMEKFDFVELRAKPLKFIKGRLQQKGVDVQLAVDLVYNCFSENYDVAVVCSGDSDLIESIKLVKNEGTKVLLFSDSKAAMDMKKYCDLFINIHNLDTTTLNKFSKVIKKEDKKEAVRAKK